MSVAMIGPKFYAWDKNGKPLAFGKLYTYQARTNDPKDTYQSEDQIVTNENPVILNGEGYANVYLSGSYKMVLKDEDENEIWTSDPVSSAEPSEWVLCLTATYVSSTIFKVNGNFTAQYEPLRKVRIDNNASEYAYSTIKSSFFSAGETTVTIEDTVVTTGIVEACISIVGPNSSLNVNTLDQRYTASFDSVDDMVTGKSKDGSQVEHKKGNVYSISGLEWELLTDSPSSVNDFKALLYVSVIDFGAKGDGITDDREAIQAAIDYCVANQGTIFFPTTSNYYSLQTVNPSHPETFLYVEPTGFGKEIGFLGASAQTKIQVDNEIAGAISLMLFAGGPGGVQSIDRTMENLSLYGGPNSSSRYVDHCLLGKEGYHPNMTITACTFYIAKVSCLRLATYVTTMINVRCAWSDYGFHLEGPNPSDVITSITMNSCYAVNCDINGYKFGYLTYSSLNACACDGVPGFAYEFAIARGVTMNGCGAESSDRILKVDSFHGFNISSFMTLSIGNDTTPPDTLIEFGFGSSASITGIVNHSSKSFEKVFKLLSNDWGSECVVFLDSSVLPSQTEYASKNWAFSEPIKFYVFDKTAKSATYTITDSQSLIDTFASVVAGREIVHDIIFQLPDGDMQITESITLFASSLTRGNGSFTLQGGASSRIVLSGDGRLIMQDSPVTVDVIFKDIDLHSEAINSGQGFVFVGRNIILKNSNITSYNSAVQYSISGQCGMNLDANSSITTSSFVSSTSSFTMKLSNEATPRAGKYPVGATQCNSAPVSGTVGWVRGVSAWIAF